LAWSSKMRGLSRDALYLLAIAALLIVTMLPGIA
jgi:hypothetical protein